MMRSRILTYALLPVLGISLAAFARTNEEKKESYQNQVQAHLQKADSKVNDLQKRAEQAGADTRAKIDEEIKKLKEQIAVAEKKLDELKTKTSGEWEHLKKSLDKSVDDLDRNYRKTEKKVEKKTGMK